MFIHLNYKEDFQNDIYFKKDKKNDYKEQIKQLKETQENNDISEEEKNIIKTQIDTTKKTTGNNNNAKKILGYSANRDIKDYIQNLVKKNYL